jgi:hypothetical protein
MTQVMLAQDTDIGLVPATTASKIAQEHANETGQPVSLHHAVTNKLLRVVKPKAAAKAKAKGKAAKAPAARKGPRGMVVKILAMASRKNGVSPAELNKLTEWRGAPWKWLFSNPKKNGYADRWGYRFKVAEVDGETRYHVTAK